LVCAVLAAVCFGVASVLQSMSARAEEGTDTGLDPRLLLRLLKRWPFVVGVALDLSGYVAMVVALRGLPVFVVEAAVAGSLAVTAVVAGRVLHISLVPKEWWAVAGVCAGLGVLGFSSGSEGAAPAALVLRYSLLASVIVLALLAFGASRLPPRAAAAGLGLVAGLGFGAVALGGRMVTGFEIPVLLSDPAAYVVPTAGVLAFLCFATALQRGGVTTATAAMTIGETVVPAAVGVFFLGDHTRHGFTVVAVLGFVVALGSALVLARFGEVDAEVSESA
jgi:hypothetical protein